MNIFLIGYRCTGKSSVGKRLAGKLQWPFLDTDTELIREAGVGISDIVREQGWEVFRDKERAIIRWVCTLDRHVVATGGGAVLDRANLDQMKGSGMLVWLKASPTMTGTTAARDAFPSAPIKTMIRIGQ